MILRGRKFHLTPLSVSAYALELTAR